MEETPSSVNEDIFQEINMQITPLPENLDFLAPHFSKHLDIWGTKIIATPGTPDEKVIHAANILAEYLDNDENGIPDDNFVISALANNKSMITMAATELDFEKILDKIDAFEIFDKGFTVQDLYGDETAPEYNFDASLEEVHHLILNFGWGEVYPDQLRQEKAQLLLMLWILPVVAVLIAHPLSTQMELGLLTTIQHAITNAWSPIHILGPYKSPRWTS